MKKFFLQNKKNIIKILDFILVISLVILSIEKGGFYKSDSISFNLIITVLGTIYVIFKSYYMFSDKIKKFKNDKIAVILFLLSICYLLPKLFNNYSCLSDTVFEFISYFNVFLIYLIVKYSDNKKIYITGIVLISFIQCIFGIDQIANRYLENILQIFNTGYLNTNLDRMSGTIQYANTFAILISVAIIIVIKKIDNIISNNKIETKNYFKFAMYNVLFAIFLICVILTKTRFAALILLIALITLVITSITKKLKITIDIIINILISFFISNAISKFIITDKTYIYLYILMFSCVYFLISFIILKIMYVVKTKTKKISKTKIIYLILFVIITTIIYLLLALNIGKDICVNEENKNHVIDIYANIKDDTNTVKIDTENISSNTIFNIKLYEITKENQTILLNEFNTENYINDSLNVENIKINRTNYKCLRMEINCEKGNIVIRDVLVNSNKYPVSYLLIPYDFVSRIKDGLSGSDSITSRFTYFKDAFSIIFDNPKNFIVGCGGETFKNMYNGFKTEKYTSTEVHNSYIQIFCESGVLGFLSIITLVFTIIFGTKKSYVKIGVLALLLHSVFDLNFSYMIILALISVLLGCLEYKENEKSNKYIKFNMIIYVIISLATIFIGINISYRLFKASIASKIYILDLEDTLTNKEEYESQLKILEIKVRLDNTEYKYINELIKQKEKYISFLKISYEEENYDIMIKQIKDIENLADYMIHTNKYNKTVLFLACDIYRRNTENFILANFNKDSKVGNNYYNNLIKNILNNIRLYYPLNQSVIEKVEQYEKLI